LVIEDITKQAVAHASGAVVASVDRFALVYARGGRSWRVHIEPLDTYYVRLPPQPTWDDGSSLTADDAQQAQRDIADTFAHWGQRCEFVPPDDPRVLPSLDQLVTYIRAQRVGASS
jgi:hypothetical protein